MDCISEEFLNKFVEKSKIKIIKKLEDVDLTSEEIVLHADLLSQVLEYSPKLYDKKIKRFKIYHLCEFNNNYDDHNTYSHKTSNFSLERKTSINEEVASNDTQTLNRISSRQYLHELNQQKKKSLIKDKYVELYIRGIVNEIIEKINEEYDEYNDKNQFVKCDTNLNCSSKNNNSKCLNEIISIKIFLEFGPKQNNSIAIDIQYKKTLRDVLIKLIKDDKIPFKNLNIYSFTSYKLKVKNKNQNGILYSKDDNDNPTINNFIFVMQEEIPQEIDTEIQLKSLNFRELYLYLKKNHEIPEVRSNSSYSQQFPDLNEQSIQINDMICTNKFDNIDHLNELKRKNALTKFHQAEIKLGKENYSYNLTGRSDNR